jgi:UDP-N-acetylmuramoyl-tripeptide--D-alanyl-D-alanine ligase
MKRFTLSQIADACGGTYIGEHSLKETPVSSIERDSRNIKENSLFLAIKGARVDGHDFIEKCYEDGAICALCEKPPVNPVKPYILVDSTLTAVKKIAKAYRELFDIPVIGISGSVGKTSTKEMISSVLAQKFKVHKTQGNLNNELGVPLTLFGMDDDTEVAVIEMGISDFGEMTRLSEMAQPTIEVITIIGDCHLKLTVVIRNCTLCGTFSLNACANHGLPFSIHYHTAHHLISIDSHAEHSKHQ